MTRLRWVPYVFTVWGGVWFGQDAVAQRWRDMDYGPFLTTTIEVDRDNIAFKAIAIRLDAGEGGVAAGSAFMAFDTDTLRYAAGWTGTGLIDWKSVVFDGSHNTHPSLVGRRIFLNPVGPGWSNPDGGDFEDPRLRGVDGKAYGPLPARWGKWRGLYRHGHKVVLSYSIGSVDILEMPGLEGVSQRPLLTRTMQIGPRDRPLVLQVAEKTGGMIRFDSIEGLGASRSPVAVLMPTQIAGGGSEDQPLADFRFDASRYFQFSQTTDFEMTKKDFSIVARIRTTEGGTIVSKAPPTGPWAPNGKTLFVRSGRLCYDVGWVGMAQSRKRVNDGRWHDIAATYQAETATLRLYIDGAPQAEKSLRPKSPAPDHILRIGFTSANFPEGQSAFEGQISSVRFFQRCLTRQELPGAAATIPHDASKLIAHWQPADVAQSTLPDRSGRGHNGRLVLGEGATRSSYGTAVAVVGQSQVQWRKTPQGQLRLRIPPGSDPIQLKLFYTPLDRRLDLGPFAEQLRKSPPPQQLTLLTEGASALWPEILETSIEPLGERDGPFEAESLNLPTENPWRSWLRLGGFDFFPDGDRAVVASWQGDVWLVRGLRSPSGPLRWQRIAGGLFQPLGLKIVDDRIYVLGRDQITLLRDINGDGETDFYENFNNDAQVTDHFHEFAMDLQTDSRGYFYYMKAARHALPAVVPQHGTLLQVSPDGSRTEVIARGMRAPDGLLVNDDGTYFTSDQEGHWTPMNRINWMRSGGFYGNMMASNPDQRGADATDLPVCWIHREIDRSPAAQVRVPRDQWGPLSGALLSLSYGTGKTFRIMYEDVDGVVQGGIVQLPIPEFPTGIQRGRFHPHDDMLYVAGLFGWSSDKTLSGGFYRIRYNKAPLLTPAALSATSTGVLLQFSVPVDPEVASDRRNYAVSRWNYRRTANYGSDDYRVSDGKPGRDTVPVHAVSVSKDKRSVFLHIPSMTPCMQMRTRYLIRSEGGRRMASTVDFTVHRLAPTKPGVRERFSDGLVPGDIADGGSRADIPVEPGLVLHLQSAGADDNTEDCRVARMVALRVDPGQAPSAFVPAGPFSAEWRGFVRLDLADRVVLSAQALGRVSIKVNGQEVLRKNARRETMLECEPVELRAGLNALSVKLASTRQGQAVMRMFWKRSGLVEEPVRPSLLVHNPASEPALEPGQTLRFGRELVGTHHCGKCHSIPDSKVVMPEFRSDSPSLVGVARRLRPSWLEQWIRDPQAMRNDITMPRVLHGADDREVADIVAYLSSLDSASGPAADRQIESPSESDSEALIDGGLVLFEDLGCIACHHFEEPDTDDPYDRTSLHYVNTKYLPGALAAFLRKPHEYHAWKRMPDYGLTEKESQSLAAYLRDSAKPVDGSDGVSGNAQRGRLAFEQRQCQACHIVQANAELPKPDLTPLFDLVERSAGCLARDASARGPAPEFALDDPQRSALIRFLATDGSSLERFIPIETGQRLINRLRCNTCHRRDGQTPQWPEILADEGEQGHAPEILPPLTWTGEKLHVDWLQKQLAGTLDYQTRPWKKARMPALPRYAEFLAKGLAAQHGVPESRQSVGPLDSDVIRIGKRLTEKDEGFHCLQCHGLPDTPPEAPFESRGIDFHRVRDRMHPEFFRRWMGNPIQFDASVPMPRFSPDGETTAVNKILDGKAQRQFQAIWQYLQSVKKQAD